MVFRSQDFPPDRQRFAEERFGASLVSQVAIDTTELNECHGNILVLVAQDLAPDRKRLLEHRRRGCKVAFFPQQDAEVVQARRDVLVLRAEGAPSGRDGLFQEWLSFVVKAQALVDLTDDRQHLGLNTWLAREILLD